MLRNYVFKVLNGLQRSSLLTYRARVAFLRVMGLRIGEDVYLAEDVYFGSTKVVLEDRAAINVGSFVDGSAPVFIGEQARLGPHVKILTGSHSIQPSVYRRDLADIVNRPVRIERGCWIGMGAIIMPGVTVAEGCVIAAGAVVTRSTEPNGLYAGAPAVLKRLLPTTADGDAGESVRDFAVAALALPAGHPLEPAADLQLMALARPRPADSPAEPRQAAAEGRSSAG